MVTWPRRKPPPSSWTRCCAGLSVTTGLRGRRRRLGDEVDRARKTVSARIHDSLERVAQVHPTLGAHLTASLTVGVRCAYRPPELVDWQLNEP